METRIFVFAQILKTMKVSIKKLIISNAADSFLTRYYSSLAFSRVNETNNYQKRDTQNWFLLTSSRPW